MQVTQSDIDLAYEQRDNDRANYHPWEDCPVARAIKRACPGVEIQVVGSAVYVGTSRVAVQLSYEVRRFIRAFDSRTGPIEPFSFELEIC